MMRAVSFVNRQEAPMVRLFRRAACVVAVAALAALPGCGIFQELHAGGDDAQWQIARFKGVSSTDVLRLAQTAVEREYPPQRLDTYRGELETGWVYGLFDDVRRQPLRQRIVVHAGVEEGVLEVKVRAQQEMNDSAGRMAGANDEGWEPTGDNVVRAQTVMQRLCILLTGIGERVPDPKSDDEKS
jgi:hypothetical protein